MPYAGYKALSVIFLSILILENHTRAGSWLQLLSLTLEDRQAKNE